MNSQDCAVCGNPIKDIISMLLHIQRAVNPCRLIYPVFFASVPLPCPLSAVSEDRLCCLHIQNIYQPAAVRIAEYTP
jgi:hypothetical protein